MISVIVPVYKVENYLSRCVDSILGQTFRELELILVDDGSPDRCGRICEEYARKDSRVHVLHQENGGLSAARNTGTDWVFANSNSQWVLYVDSDDWLHPETLERLYGAARELDVRISICGYGETAGEVPAVLPEQLVPRCWEPKIFYTEQFINATVAWGKLYHRSCLEGIRYPKGKIHEDEFVTYRLLFAEPKVAVISAPLYAYFQNAVGITKKAWSPKRLDAWEAYEQQIAFFEDRHEDDMVRHRYRGYLENAMVNLKAAEGAPDCPEMRQVRCFMEKRIRSVIRRAWKRGYMSFWPDFDLLYRFFPMKTRVYRFGLEIRSRLGRKRNG